MLLNGLLSHRGLLVLFAVAFAATTVLGLAMVASRGLVMLPFGLAGVLGAVCYTMPPVRAAYRPMAGELVAFTCLALCVIGAAVLQHGTVDAELLLVAAAVAGYAVGMLMVHHFLDHDADRAAVPQKRTTIVALGLRRGRRYAIAWCAGALACAAAALADRAAAAAARRAATRSGLAAHLRCRPDDVESVTKSEMADHRRRHRRRPALGRADRAGARLDADRGGGADRRRAADGRAAGPGDARPDRRGAARAGARRGRRRAGDDESVVAVLPAEPGSGSLVYLVAFDRDGELSYLALDEGHRPVDDRRLVRDAVAMLALAERAEEVAGAAVAEELAAALEAVGGGAARRRLRRRSRRPPARRPRRGRLALDRVAQGPRVATPAYLDRLAATALELGAALAVYETRAGLRRQRRGGRRRVPEHLHDAWRAAALARSAGSPGELPVLLAATTGAAEALADDVVGRYRVPLV